MKLKRLKASTALMTRQTDAEQRRPTIKKLEVKLVEFKLGEDCWEIQIDPILEKFAGELAHIAPIPPGIVEADFDPDDDTSSDDDDFEDIEYISLEEVEQEEKEFDLEDIFQVQDVILREKLLNVHRLISNIKSLKVNSTPDRVLESPSPFPIPVVDSDAFFEESDTSFSHLDNSLPEFETFSDHSEETRSGKFAHCKWECILVVKAHVILLKSQLLVKLKNKEIIKGIIRNYYDGEDGETTTRFEVFVKKREKESLKIIVSQKALPKELYKGSIIR
ncbi:hypothetical protein Tco_0211592 [Tanacetum coccineum]